MFGFLSDVGGWSVISCIGSVWNDVMNPFYHIKGSLTGIGISHPFVYGLTSKVVMH